MELEEGEGVPCGNHEPVVGVATEERHTPFPAALYDGTVDDLRVRDSQKLWQEGRAHVHHVRNHHGEISPPIVQIGL
jgi:hypothetical protein